MEERLQKIIARAGITSRRRAEELMLAGEVTVNGRVVTELGAKADPERDHIKVGSRLIRGPQRPIYLLLHKPAGHVSALHDPEGRPTVADLVKNAGVRVYPVGQLDYDEQGLMLLTNDGDLTNRLMKLAGALPQTYWIKVKGHLNEQELMDLQRDTGLRLKLVKHGENAWYEVAIREISADTFFGENWDHLRPVLVRMGHPIEKIKRTSLATLKLGSTPYGEYRRLTVEEVEALTQFVARTERRRQGSSAKPAQGKQGNDQPNR